MTNSGHDGEREGDNEKETGKKVKTFDDTPFQVPS